jgi:ATP adenylyltransferase
MEYFFNFDKMAYLRKDKSNICTLCMIRDSNPAVIDCSVHESENFIVSMNLYPYNPGHVIVFPKEHFTDIREFQQNQRRELDSLIDICLNVLDATYHPSGYNIGYNMGPVAGASIDHIHLHIIPRYPREIGIAELIAGKRVMVEDPVITSKRLKTEFIKATSEGLS